MPMANRRAGRSPGSIGGGGGNGANNKAAARVSTQAAGGSGGPSPWLIRVALVALGLTGCALIASWAGGSAAAGAGAGAGAGAASPSSSSSTAGGAAANLMGRLTGRAAQQRREQEAAAKLDAYCEAPLTGLEGPAHLPPLPTAGADGSDAPVPKLRQLQVVIRHGDRSPINSLTTPPPRFSCRLRDPAMAELARRMKEDGEDATFRVVGIGGTASRAYLTTALLPPATAAEGEEQQQQQQQQQACFPGQLTEKGFRQQVANGRFLRERYAEALGPIADPATDLYFRTTNYPRTFQSGAALLLSYLGLADATADADPDASAPSALRNITVFVQEENGKEPMFGNGLIGASRPRSVDPFEAPPNERGPCPLAFHLGARQEAAFAPDAGIDQQFYSELGLAPLAAADKAAAGSDGDKAATLSAEERARRKAEQQAGGGGVHPTELSVADQADPLMGMHCHAKTLPVSLGTAARLKGEADRLFCQRFTGEDGGREGTRLGMQPFLTEVLDRFKQAAEGTAAGGGGGGEKLALYSAHDTVIAPLVAALDGYDAADECRDRWPPYASRVVMELWEVEGAPEPERHLLRFLFNGQAISDRARHCPGYKPAGAEGLDASLLPMACFERYVDGLDDEAGESCLDA